MNDADHPMHSTFLRVLEDWAMMLVDEDKLDFSVFDRDQPFYISHVDVHGAFHGTISVVAQRPFLTALAQSLLGADEPESVSEGEIRDAFKEMGNVLAGNFLTAAYGEEESFDILNPRVLDIAAADFETLTHAPQSYIAMADETPVCVTFEIREKKK